MVITRALIALYQSSQIAQSLAFRGGTALNKLFIQPASRYSEDLDFVQLAAEPIGNTLDAIRSILDPWLGTPKRKLTGRSAKLIYRYAAVDGTASRLKLEINTTEHFHILPIQHYVLHMSSPWYIGQAKITSYLLDELMATKLRALYQRKKGRDLFDLWIVFERNLVNIEQVIAGFNEHGERQNEQITRAMFEENLHAKKYDKAFRSDILPLLAQGTV